LAIAAPVEDEAAPHASFGRQRLGNKKPRTDKAGAFDLLQI